jgi:hypothetical protein
MYHIQVVIGIVLQGYVQGAEDPNCAILYVGLSVLLGLT